MRIQYIQKPASHPAIQYTAEKQAFRIVYPKTRQTYITVQPRTFNTHNIEEEKIKQTKMVVVV